MESLGLLTLAPLIAALLAGAALGWWLTERNTERRVLDARKLAGAEADSARAVAEERARGLAQQLEQARAELAEAARQEQALGEKLSLRATRIGELETELNAATKNQAENEARLKAVIADTEKRFTDVFKALAGQILEEKTAKFTETNRTRLNELLLPFREQLGEFRRKIEETHLSEATERRSLKDELKRLMDLNQQVSQDAKNLTSALKGEAKTQGTWGEVILERVLEMSGLVKGREYIVQDSREADDGSRLQPDVVIRLPEDRHLVVDSKVSLVADQ